MNGTAAYALGLILIGGPVSMLAPFVIARRLVERHTAPADAPSTLAAGEAVQIIQARTGAPCTVVPNRRVIVVDPALTREAAARLIRTALPQASTDEIAQWVGGIAR
ncbi:hypothetical protein [Micromonospora mirobrigensis]|uniref:Uncharacterized protein n=1 Tax=Micromonospora mirobrigensis TaxID=262898 RepID=A0A1C5AIK6_9ACTN|nr:hypothetical protein [Micromonospora mirobrigensis]SCF45047.1 hypothetical protein GA0070564_11128 [Micromonospora mirobrigensis]